jgi:hypothetical protein
MRYIFMPTFGEKEFLFCKNITYFSMKTVVSIVDVHTYIYIFPFILLET